MLSRRLISGLESSLCLSCLFSAFFLMPSMSLWGIIGHFEGLVAWSSLQTLGSRGRERGLVRGGGDPLPSRFSRLLDLCADWPLTGSNCCRLGLSSTLCCLFNSFFVRLLQYGIITELDWHIIIYFNKNFICFKHKMSQRQNILSTKETQPGWQYKLGNSWTQVY